MAYKKGASKVTLDDRDAIIGVRSLSNDSLNHKYLQFNIVRY
jgi:hypothetical protein